MFSVAAVIAQRPRLRSQFTMRFCQRSRARRGQEQFQPLRIGRHFLKAGGRRRNSENELLLTRLGNSIALWRS